MPNSRNSTDPKNPFQPPELVSSNETLGLPDDEGLSFTERIEKYRRARKRWSVRCWALGLLFVGLSLATSPIAEWTSQYQQPVASAVIMGAGIVSLILGAFIVVLGPISWFWFHRRGGE